MEVAVPVTSISKAFNFNVLATSVDQRPANPIALIPIWSTKKLSLLTICASNSISRDNTHTHLFLTRCSTQPGTNTNNGRGQDSSTGSNPSLKLENPSTPVSNNSLASSFSSPSLSRGLVFDLGTIEWWDCNEIGSPVVRRFLGDEEERWYMWYHGNSSKKPEADCIGLAVSKNGIHWERGTGPVISSGDVGIVMNCSQDWWAFDTMSIRPSQVLIMSSNRVKASSAVYWLYYSGFSSEKVDFVDDDSLEFNLENPERFCFENNNHGNGKIFKSLPGLAMSQDGRHWARIEGDHHSGALFDVGTEREWDSLFIASPRVVFHGNGDLRMYYHSFDMENGQFAIGIARSRDGIKWVKLGKIMGGGKIGSFDEYGVMNPSVVKSKKGGKYVMAYEGVAADGRRSIGLAVSPDGLKDWRRFQDEEVLRPSEKDAWDSKGIGCPCLVQMDGDDDEWRLYYRGIGNGGRTGIGMAFCLGNDISSFRRWTGFPF